MFAKIQQEQQEKVAKTKADANATIVKIGINLEVFQEHAHKLDKSYILEHKELYKSFTALKNRVSSNKKKPFSPDLIRTIQEFAKTVDDKLEILKKSIADTAPQVVVNSSASFCIKEIEWVDEDEDNGEGATEGATEGAAKDDATLKPPSPVLEADAKDNGEGATAHEDFPSCTSKFCSKRDFSSIVHQVGIPKYILNRTMPYYGDMSPEQVELFLKLYYSIFYVTKKNWTEIFPHDIFINELLPKIVGQFTLMDYDQVVSAITDGEGGIDVIATLAIVVQVLGNAANHIIAPELAAIATATEIADLKRKCDNLYTENVLLSNKVNAFEFIEKKKFDEVTNRVNRLSTGGGAAVVNKVHEDSSRRPQELPSDNEFLKKDLEAFKEISRDSKKKLSASQEALRASQEALRASQEALRASQEEYNALRNQLSSLGAENKSLVGKVINEPCGPAGVVISDAKITLGEVELHSKHFKKPTNCENEADSILKSVMAGGEDVEYMRSGSSFAVCDRGVLVADDIDVLRFAIKLGLLMFNPLHKHFTKCFCCEDNNAHPFWVVFYRNGEFHRMLVHMVNLKKNPNAPLCAPCFAKEIGIAEEFSTPIDFIHHAKEILHEDYINNIEGLEDAFESIPPVNHSFAIKDPLSGGANDVEDSSEVKVSSGVKVSSEAEVSSNVDGVFPDSYRRLNLPNLPFSRPERTDDNEEDGDEEDGDDEDGDDEDPNDGYGSGCGENYSSIASDEYYSGSDNEDDFGSDNKDDNPTIIPPIAPDSATKLSTISALDGESASINLPIQGSEKQSYMSVVLKGNSSPITQFTTTATAHRTSASPPPLIYQHREVEVIRGRDGKPHYLYKIGGRVVENTRIALNDLLDRSLRETVDFTDSFFIEVWGNNSEYMFSDNFQIYLKK